MRFVFKSRKKLWHDLFTTFVFLLRVFQSPEIFILIRNCANMILLISENKMLLILITLWWLRSSDNAPHFLRFKKCFNYPRVITPLFLWSYETLWNIQRGMIRTCWVHYVRKIKVMISSQQNYYLISRKYNLEAFYMILNTF